MPFHEAVRLALQQIRVQKLKSFFTLLGVMIGVMFLIAVVSIVDGHEQVRRGGFRRPAARREHLHPPALPWFGNNVTEDEWREWQRRPRVYHSDVAFIRNALPAGHALRRREPGEPDAPPASTRGRARSRRTPSRATTSRSRSYDLTDGRVFSPAGSGARRAGRRDRRRGGEVLLPGLNPIGRELRIGGIPYRSSASSSTRAACSASRSTRRRIAPFNSPLHRLTNPRGDIDGLHGAGAERGDDGRGDGDGARGAARASPTCGPARPTTS